VEFLDQTPRFFGIIRESFKELYDMEVFEGLYDQLYSQVKPELRDKFPPLPLMGSLDSETVLDSLYCFA